MRVVCGVRVLFMVLHCGGRPEPLQLAFRKCCNLHYGRCNLYPPEIMAHGVQVCSGKCRSGYQTDFGQKLSLTENVRRVCLNAE